MHIIILFIYLLLLSGSQKKYAESVQQTPVSVILDTDMDSDVDDVGALAMLHSYERKGMAKILGIIVTSDELYSAACTDAINTYFQKGDIPIGVSQEESLKTFSKYTYQITQEFPHKISSNQEAEDGTKLYRRLLASQPDKSVVVITIGHLTSLSRLLNSQPDKVSPLNGAQLVAKKVKYWSCMGGQFPNGKEANFYRPDPASTVTCLAKWKLPVTFSGWEAGNQVVTGGEFFKTKCETRSPVYRAYELYNGFKGRASWDQIAVLEAIEGVNPYFSLVSKGYCYVGEDGSNEWRSKPDKAHNYLKIKAPIEQIQGRIEELMLAK